MHLCYSVYVSMELLILLILGALYTVAAQTEDVIVSTVYGDVIGQGIPLASGKVINSFLGMPYAKPPVGDLRFTVCIILSKLYV